MRNLDDARHPVEVLDFIGVVRGLRVLVVERDPGYFGEIVGAALGDGGRVTELIDPAAMTDTARAALSDAIGVAPALAPLVASPATVRLAPGSFDLVLLYRAGDRGPAMAAGDERRDMAPPAGQLFAAVRPGGIVGVVARPVPADDGEAAGGAEIERTFAAAGFVLDRAGRVRGGDRGDQPGSTADEPRLVILRFRKPE